jgi:hypothetical protein
MDSNSFAATLRKDDKGRIIYTYRGGIERGVGGSYKWFNGYSATTLDGGILYPWMTKRACQRDAKLMGHKAAFVEEDGR